jgi:hypothetical protein
VPTNRHSAEAPVCFDDVAAGPSAMRCLLVPIATAVGLFACEQRFSSNPTPIGPQSFTPASSSDTIDQLIAPTDAGLAALSSSRAVTLTVCSSSPQACPSPETDGSTTASYRVVFGSGRGELRSRGQAMADLYKELRDRTASGERLNAQSHALGDAGARAGGGWASADSKDPIARCALHLLDVVDSAGELTLDVLHGFGSNGCMVSLGPLAADGGATQCLVKEPERPKGRSKGGFEF